jgi:hypothetical protein
LCGQALLIKGKKKGGKEERKRKKRKEKGRKKGKRTLTPSTANYSSGY